MKSLKTELKQRIEAKKQPPKVAQPRFQGKGTRSRLNTAAEKHMFKSQYST